MKNLQKLDELKHMDQLQHLQQLPQLQHMDQLQHIESLDKLQPLAQLQHLDKLANLQQLDKLQNLSVMKNMHFLEQLQHMDHLQQLQLLNRLGELQELDRLKNMQILNKLHEMRSLSELPQLSNLQYMENLRQLNNLHRLQQLEVLNRLRILDKLLAFNFTSLLYLLSILVPGLVFQETIALLMHGRMGLKRSLVLMIVYNVLNILVCIVFAFNLLEQFAHQPFAYYSIWFSILILIPFLAGGLVTLLARMPHFGKLAEFVSVAPRHVTNAWERFFSGKESYRVIITLNNEEKIMGIFQRNMEAPKTADPNDIYLTETSHYNPQAREWQDLKQPVNAWVKGSEIKMVELSTET
jgi:uncharacterized membrane protein